uniref:Pectin acetylesterase n=1 Tax=Chloropicon laureae TaxID=464258 RepID=A0A7S2Z2W9_9CHLO
MAFGSGSGSKAGLLVALISATALLHVCAALQPLAQGIANLGDLLEEELGNPVRSALGGLSPADGYAGLNLELLSDAPKHGAACLDGSPPGYYFRPGSGSGASSFLLFVDGGGWCYDEDACFERSFTILGSSSAWPPYKPASLMFPMVSADPAVNPFHNWNIVELAYCDGASFSGDLDGSVVVKGKPLYFRGRKILSYILRHLRETKGLQDADRVLLAGCSAGALASILNADSIASSLAPKTDFKVIPFSGFFPRATTFSGVPWFEGVVRNVARMQNVSASLSPRCVANQSPGKEWECLFAEKAYEYVASPIFLVNSVFDSWTIQNIYNVTAEFPRSQADQLVPFLNERASHVWDLISRSGTWQRRGNGGFLNACVTHCWGCCEASGWAKVTDARGRTVKEAVEDWSFHSGGHNREDQRSPKPCQLSDDPPYNCNPTCPTAA